jgi:hypothetical protein
LTSIGAEQSNQKAERLLAEKQKQNTGKLALGGRAAQFINFYERKLNGSFLGYRNWKTGNGLFLASLNYWRITT